MKNPSFALATALLLCLGATHQANAFSIGNGNSEFADSNGTSRFSDPDEKYENMASPPATGGPVNLLPFATGGSSVTLGVTEIAPSCSATTGCTCPNCAGR